MWGGEIGLVQQQGGDTDFFIFGGSIIEEEREIEVSSNSK